jgi:hypothetical protein
MKVYKAVRTDSEKVTRNTVRGNCQITVDGKTLRSVLIDPKNDPRCTGKVFDWSCEGIYALNASESILVDFIDDDKIIIPEDIIRAFYDEYNVPARYEDWEVTEDEIRMFVTTLLQQEDDSEEIRITHDNYNYSA